MEIIMFERASPPKNSHGPGFQYQTVDLLGGSHQKILGHIGNLDPLATKQCSIQPEFGQQFSGRETCIWNMYTMFNVGKHAFSQMLNDSFNETCIWLNDFVCGCTQFDTLQLRGNQAVTRENKEDHDKTWDCTCKDGFSPLQNETCSLFPYYTSYICPL